MITRSIYPLAMLLLLAGCSRQAGRSTATTAQAVSQPSGDPVPVELIRPMDESTIPAQPAAIQPVPDESAAEPSRSPATIPARTRFRVRLAEGLDTKTSRSGDRFVAYLEEPIVSGDWVVVPKGTAFEGRVIEAKQSGRLKGRAYLGVTLDSFQLHGSTYMIATGPDIRASSRHRKRNLAIIGGTAGSGAAIGAVAGGGVGALIGAGAGAAAGTTGAFITGKKNVRLPVESTLVFSLRSAVTVGS